MHYCRRCDEKSGLGTSIMVNFVPISAKRHAGKAWQRPVSLAFASTQAVVPLVGAEFARAAISMPIAFIEQVGLYIPVAAMSPVSGRNLFIGPAGQWLSAYVPAALRSYPFRLGHVEDAQRVILCIDEDSGLVVETDGKAENFIDDEGNPTPTSKAMLDFLLAMEQNRIVTEKAVSALTEAGVIQPWQCQATIDGQAVSANGLFCVDEAMINALDDTAFLRLRRAGALALAYLQLLSMNQIAMFDQLAVMQQRLAQTHQQQGQMTSLDEIFRLPSSETLRFN
jgi:hypothetical protein